MTIWAGKKSQAVLTRAGARKNPNASGVYFDDVEKLIAGIDASISKLNTLLAVKPDIVDVKNGVESLARYKSEIKAIMNPDVSEKVQATVTASPDEKLNSEEGPSLNRGPR